MARRSCLNAVAVRSAVIVAAIIFHSSVRAAEPATQPAAAILATISGSVFTLSATSDRPLGQIVVYLEAKDPTHLPAPSASPVVISQRDARFLPALLVVAAGQTVEFRNDEVRPIEHNVFSRSPLKPFDLGLYRPGAANKSVTFDKPGVVRLYCSIHRYMDGLIYVAPTQYFATIDAEGKYKIEHVPAGEYTVHTWQRTQRFPEQQMNITAAPGATQTVGLELKAE